MNKPVILLVLCLLFIQWPAAKQFEAVEANNHCVILLHGLVRTSGSMWWFSRQLKQNGFKTVNTGYFSMSNRIDALAESTIPKAISDCNQYKSQHISFLTHSMGGILVRSYLQSHKIENLHSIIMLAPPNQGSEAVDRYLENQIVDRVIFDSFRQLSSKKASYVNSLEPINASVAVIAGSKSYNPTLSEWIPGIDDGKVSVASACLNEMQEMLIMPVNHTSITWNSDVFEQVRYFLNHRTFNDETLLKRENAYRIQQCSQLKDVLASIKSFEEQVNTQ
ncbi:esterase/lipase family protein [Pleionea sediminis]|uniref:esterase/lipase family protein n=1 Tax=Pleionea sediminis TaxID=2569479 RepID=UPI001185ED51|nr:alpha/beta hydrolase [Pleionea sediminis]